MSVEQLTSYELPKQSRPVRRIESDLPDLEEIPLHVRNLATLRGLGFSFRQISKNYGVTPQAASLMLARQKALLKSARRHSELSGLSPRAVNCLGRLGVRSKDSARTLGSLEIRLQGMRNCGQKTIREILDWASV